jgi:surfactin synthase thioesterase subunit
MSAHRAPHIPLPRRPTWNLPRPDFLQRLVELKGTPRQVLENDEMLALILPRMRADLRMDETYRHSTTHPSLSCAITVLGGIDDAETTPQQLEAWRHVTGGPFELRMFEGDHFFIQSHRTSLIDTVAAALDAS